MYTPCRPGRTLHFLELFLEDFAKNKCFVRNLISSCPHKHYFIILLVCTVSTLHLHNIDKGGHIGVIQYGIREHIGYVSHMVFVGVEGPMFQI